MDETSGHSTVDLHSSTTGNTTTFRTTFHKVLRVYRTGGKEIQRLLLMPRPPQGSPQFCLRHKAQSVQAITLQPGLRGDGARDILSFSFPWTDFWRFLIWGPSVLFLY